MSRNNEGCGLAERLESARMTARQHADGGTCFHCKPSGCDQNLWAQQELTQHARRDPAATPHPLKAPDAGRPAAVHTHPGAPDDAARPVDIQPAEPQRLVRAVGTVPARPTLLADEFWFMAHDDQTGRPRLFESALNHGLAAALLAELYGEGRITFKQGQIELLQPWPPRNWLQHVVLDRLIAQPQHSDTRTWLAFLAATAGEQVIDRMWQVGLLRQEQVGRLWRQRTIHVPTDVNVAASSWARLSVDLRFTRRLNSFDVVLAGLALHTQLDRALLDGASLAVRTHLRQVVAQTPQPVRDLLADLSSAVGGSVLSHRT
ncbi:GPP34 family phosphoprotein [Micromonospora sp. NPDC049051]|uniref:GOLPH3/VPS74 family protein n=1 Tax=Micromonospora sp. NPDC049051 TaxID=3364264 RepID=UPI003711746F